MLLASALHTYGECLTPFDQETEGGVRWMIRFTHHGCTIEQSIRPDIDGELSRQDLGEIAVVSMLSGRLREGRQEVPLFHA